MDLLNGLKKVPVLFILLFFNLTFSQQSAKKSGDKSFKVNVKKMAGIIVYDTEEVIKKIKIKKTDTKNYVEWAIDKYNEKINELKIFNTDTFSEVNIYINQKRQEAQLSNDINILKEAKLKVDETLQPLKDKVEKAKTTLNHGFEKHLNAKQYKSWLKYVKRKKEGSKSYSSGRSPMRSQSMRNYRGQGMRRY